MNTLLSISKTSLLLSIFLLSSIGLSAQNIFNRRIPQAAHVKIQALKSQGINTLSFAPNGGWIVTTNRGQQASASIPSACLQKVKAYQRAGRKIKDVIFHPAGGDRWIVLTDAGFFARGIPDACYQKMNQLKSQGQKITQVVFPPNKTNRESWLILTESGRFHAKNIDDECYQMLKNLSQSPYGDRQVPRKINYVAFSPNGGWLILAQDYHITKNIDRECDSRLNTYKNAKTYIKRVVFTPKNNGWSILYGGRYIQGAKDPIRDFEASVANTSLQRRMQALKIPGVSVAMVINSKLAWSTGYGHLNKESTTHAVHPNSIFQAASISKVLAAIGAYEMIELGKVRLDDNLNNNGFLENPIPANSCLRNFRDRGQVTIRNILNHQSGIDGGNDNSNINAPCNEAQGRGYRGYVSTIRSQDLPNIDQIVLGQSPASTKRVRITYDNARGLRNNYSGPAFSVLQKLTEDLNTGSNYASWMDANVLKRMGMQSSSFTTNPEAKYANQDLSMGFDFSKNSAIRNRYPESAAAGLYTNAEDLANVIIMLNQNGIFNGRRVLNPNSVKLLRDDGVGINKRDGNVRASNSYYAHGGTNEGYKTFLIGFPDIKNHPKGVKNAGIIVMINSDQASFRYEIINAIIKAYNL